MLSGCQIEKYSTIGGEFCAKAVLITRRTGIPDEQWKEMMLMGARMHKHPQTDTKIQKSDTYCVSDVMKLEGIFFFFC